MAEEFDPKSRDGVVLDIVKHERALLKARQAKREALPKPHLVEWTPPPPTPPESKVDAFDDSLSHKDGTHAAGKADPWGGNAT